MHSELKDYGKRVLVYYSNYHIGQKWKKTKVTIQKQIK